MKHNPDENGAVAKDGIYIWVTWLSKLLADQSSCKWAVWYKIHFKYEALKRGFDLERWTKEHDELVQFRARQLRNDGYDVYIEDENRFAVQGCSGAIVAGKPDILALRDGVAYLEDCKTGKKRGSDHVQVAIYKLLAPFYFKSRSVAQFSGRLIYPDGDVSLDGNVEVDLGARMAQMIRELAGSDPPSKAPSARECRYCDIASRYCDRRIEDPDARVYVTDAF